MKTLSVIISVGVLVILALGTFMILSGSKGSSTGLVTAETNTKVITLQASRFQYSPGTITVNKGDHVKIVVNNTDTIHGIVIPDLGVSGIDSLEFVADKVGTFQFKCPTMCGSGHKNMTGTLIVQ